MIPASLPSGVPSGTKITARSPVPAHMVESAPAALPVDATQIVRTPLRMAWATTMALARSLNEALGSRASSLSQIARMSSAASSAGAR